MSAPTRHTPVVTSYARALLQLAVEGNRMEDVGRELGELAELVAAQPVLREFLADPAIADAKRAALLKRVFHGRVSPLLWNFLGVLEQKKRLPLLTQIAQAYDDLMDEAVGKVEVDVTVAKRLTPEELANAQQAVSRALGKEAVIHVYVDEAIIGGLVIRARDQLIDGSVRARVAAMKEHLLDAKSQLRQGWNN